MSLYKYNFGYKTAPWIFKILLHPLDLVDVIIFHIPPLGTVHKVICRHGGGNKLLVLGIQRVLKVLFYPGDTV